MLKRIQKVKEQIKTEAVTKARKNNAVKKAEKNVLQIIKSNPKLLHLASILPNLLTLIVLCVTIVLFFFSVELIHYLSLPDLVLCLLLHTISKFIPILSHPIQLQLLCFLKQPHPITAADNNSYTILFFYYQSLPTVTKLCMHKKRLCILSSLPPSHYSQHKNCMNLSCLTNEQI